MNDSLPRGLQHKLVLADGSRWFIAAGDEEAAAIVSRLADAMRLGLMNPSTTLPRIAAGTSRMGAVEPTDDGMVRRLIVLVAAHNAEASALTGHVSLSIEDDGACVLPSFVHSDGLFVQLMQLSSILARAAQTRGGVLLHGALAEKDGAGVILAAPGGTGKSTASGRFPPPWRSLCDDTTLVVPDALGNYWAHPWPTWSRFLWGDSGGTWDVQHAVPLKGVFFLSRALEDHVESIGPGHALSLLVESAQQASQLMGRGLATEETRALHLERFDNLCALARVVPAHLLHISLTGAFWEEIEQTLEGSQREGA